MALIGRVTSMSNKVSVGGQYGRLTVTKKTAERKRGKIVWECICDCGKFVTASTTDLTSGDTRSCGCLKKEMEQKNLREKYDKKRVDGVAIHLFDDKPRKDSSTGYRGVSKYYTRVSKEERYRAWITVDGKRFYKSGFKTPEDAYHQGRLTLEEKHLPKKIIKVRKGDDSK